MKVTSPSSGAPVTVGLWGSRELCAGRAWRAAEVGPELGQLGRAWGRRERAGQGVRRSDPKTSFLFCGEGRCGASPGMPGRARLRAAPQPLRLRSRRRGRTPSRPRPPGCEGQRVSLRSCSLAASRSISGRSGRVAECEVCQSQPGKPWRTAMVLGGPVSTAPARWVPLWT